MIRNFEQWNNEKSQNEINEGVVGDLLRYGTKGVSKAGKYVGKTVGKGIKSGANKLFGKTPTISKLRGAEKEFDELLKMQDESWYQSLDKTARKSLEKQYDDIGKKLQDAYTSGSTERVTSVRQELKQVLNKSKRISDEAKYNAEHSEFIKEVPSRPMRKELETAIEDSNKALDDAANAKTPEEFAEKMRKARMHAQKVDDFKASSGRTSSYADEYARTGRTGARTGYAGSRYDPYGRARYGSEPGSNINDDAFNTVKNEGPKAAHSKIKTDLNDSGKSNFRNLFTRGPKDPSGEGKGLWNMFKKTIKISIALGAISIGGSLIWNYIKAGKQNESSQSYKDCLDDSAKTFAEQGITETKIDTSKAQFLDVFKIFFSGGKEDLPVDDAEELKSLVSEGATVATVFSSMAQLCFQYPKRYFEENKSELEGASSFIKFFNSLEEKIGVAKVVKAVQEAEGMAAEVLEETFYENGNPVSLGESGYASYSNPNMKILLGSNQPVNAGDLLEESTEFIRLFSSFKRRIDDDFIKSTMQSALTENGIITQEEMDERTERIRKDLYEQLSEKEEVFVAMIAIILSYKSKESPFSQIYRFDDNSLYDTVEAINELTGDSFNLASSGQLQRIYLSISGDVDDVYRNMGKERTLFGVMEYSSFGSVMRSMINLFLLERICRVIVSSDNEVEESFSSQEIKNYQTVISQIQRAENVPVTVSVTGTLDDDTQEAITFYQKKLSLPETGKPGEKSLVKFNSYLESLVTSKT